MLASFRVEVFSTLIHGDASPNFQAQNTLLMPPSSVEIREECQNFLSNSFIALSQVWHYDRMRMWMSIFSLRRRSLMPETVVHFQVRMPPDIHERLASWAKTDKASLNQLVVDILKKAVEMHEGQTVGAGNGPAHQHR